MSSFEIDEGAYHPYSCELPLEVVGTDDYRHFVVYLPPELAKHLPFDKPNARLRVAGEIGDVPFKLAWQPTKEGRHYLLLNPRLRREAGLDEGSIVSLRFRVDAPDAVDVPEEIAALTARSRKRTALWDELTPGRRRGISHWVDSAKGEDVRKRRADTVFEALEAGVRAPQEIAKFKRAARAKTASKPKKTR